MATEFVRFNEASRSFEVSPDAVQLLRRLPGPVCVVSVCGRARQGKSFLLNQLLAKLKAAAPPASAAGSAAARQQSASASGGGFAVASTVRPCTKGLWLWSQPLQMTQPNGQPYHLLLVDCEGIDAFDQTADYSNQIFSLGLLLSGMLIYNQMGAIDESSVDKLAAVCEFARLIHARSGGGGGASGASGRPGEEGTDLRDLSPNFLWLLRDFQFQMTEDGRQLRLPDYMEEVLRELPPPAPGAGPAAASAVQAKNQLRSSIKGLFPQRDCFALVRPLLDEARLASMDRLPLEQLRPEFRQGLDALAGVVQTRARPKRLRGQVLTGPALAAFAQAYVDVINKGQVPAIASTWQSVVQSECRRALDAAMDLHAAKLQETRGPAVGADAVDAALHEALAAAEAAFQAAALGEPGERAPFLKRLHDSAAAAAASLRAAKQAEAEALAAQLLAGAARQIGQLLEGDGADLEEAERALHSFLKDTYHKQAQGPAKYIKAAEFLAGNVVPELRRVAQRWQAKAREAAQRTQQLEERLRQAAATAEQLGAAQAAATAGAQQLELTKQQLAAAQADAAAAAARTAAGAAALEAARREAAEARGALAAARVEAQARAEDAQTQMARLRADLAAAQALRTSAEATAQQAGAAARAAAAQQLASREAELAAAEAAAAAARQEAAALRAQLEQARAAVEAAHAEVARREATIGNLQQARHFMQAQLEEQHRRLSGSPAAFAPAHDQQQQQQAGAPGQGADPLPAGQQQTPAAAAQRGGAAGRKRARGGADAPTDDVLDADGDADMADAERAAEEQRQQQQAAAASAAAGKRQRVTPARGRAAAPPAAAQQQRQATPPPAEEEQEQRRRQATPTPPPPAAAQGQRQQQQQRTPFSAEREVLRSPNAAARGATPPAGGAAAAGAAGAAPKPALPEGLDKMTVNELKAWLTDHGFEDDVWRTNNAQGSRPAKKDWLALLRSKCA